jgi:hypothetical protein
LASNITAAVDGDGCCPPGADATTDDDGLLDTSRVTWMD